jgi:hypothetical protein
MAAGLSAATLQGAPVVTQDVGLWFEKLGDLKIARALQSVGAAYVPPSHLNPPMLAGPGAELFDIVVRMDGLDTFAREPKHCVDVPLGRHKLKVLSLPRILASQQARLWSTTNLARPFRSAGSSDQPLHTRPILSTPVRGVGE